MVFPEIKKYQNKSFKQNKIPKSTNYLIFQFINVYHRDDDKAKSKKVNRNGRK